MTAKAKYKPVKNKKTGRKTAGSNKGQPITGTPTLRLYSINKTPRLVWVWRENGEVRIRVNENLAISQRSPRSQFKNEYADAIKSSKTPMTVKKIPPNVRDALAKLSEDDIEWAGGIDFEGDIDLPERFLIKSGKGDYVIMKDLDDFELTFHTHPIDSELGYMPSIKDLLNVTLDKPHIIVWTNQETGRKKFVLIRSHNTFPGDEKELKQARKKCVDRHGTNESKGFWEDYKEELNKLGFSVDDIDPVRTPIAMRRDDRPEKTIKIQRNRDEFTKKGVQQLLNKPYALDGTDMAYSKRLVEIREYLLKTKPVLDRDDKMMKKVDFIISEDIFDNPKAKVSQLKILVEMKKVTELRKDVKKSQMPYIDDMDINAGNYDRVKRDLKEWKQTDKYKEIKAEAFKQRMKKRKRKKRLEVRHKRTTGKPMNMGLQQNRIAAHLNAKAKDDDFYKIHADAAEIEDMESYIDPTLSLEENILEIDNMMRYGAFEHEKPLKSPSKKRVKKQRKKYNKMMEFHAPKKVSKKTTIELDPSINVPPKVDVEKLSLTKTSDGKIKLRVDAVSTNTTQTKLSKPLTTSEKKELKRLKNWKAIKRDPKLYKPLQKLTSD